MQKKDTELLLGTEVESDMFADHNVGRAMDHIHEVGAARVFSEGARRAAILYNLDLSSGHWDSTSVSVWGDYNVYNEKDEADSRLRIDYGYSKDGRPDLKQFMVEMLCVEGNIPIMGDSQDGSSSDKTLNNKLLNRIGKSMSKNGLREEAFTYIAGSAMFTEDNLKCFLPVEDQPPFYFVTRLPFNYSETNRVVKEAVQANAWQPIEQIAGMHSHSNRPVAQYQSYESNVTLYGNAYRATVIHSDAHDKRRQKRLQRELDNSYSMLKSELHKSTQKQFYCHPDAEAELTRLNRETSALYHTINGRVEERVKYARGRPPKNGPRKEHGRHYVFLGEIIEKAEAVAQKRAEAGCFVLLTNRPFSGEDKESSEELLRTYRAQNGIEQNFRFLKDPLIVNDLFLKKPERIEVLGMVFLMCLLIWNLMQRTMRSHIEDSNEDLEGWDGKRTTRPTPYMMMKKFTGLLVVRRGNERLLKPALSGVQRAYLRALNLPEEVFTNPRVPI